MTPSIKHKDADGDSVMTTAAAAPSTPRHNDTTSSPFSRLPPEIIKRVFLLACRLPPLTTTTSQPASTSTRWHLTLDLPTTLSLAQVSKSVHKIATKALYSAIRLTRPSDVICLLRTLKGRPELGKLVQNLHIGAEETFKASEWPLLLVRTDEKGVPLERPELWLRTSQRKKELLPEWCEVGRAWRIEPEDKVEAAAIDGKEKAVRLAIQAAMRDIDIDPYRRGYGKSKQKIGLEEWSIRLYLLQASLDMYLLQLRRIDDIEPFSGPSYPGLTITPSTEPKPPKWDRKENVVKFTLGLLWLKLVERGGTLDQFDHPIIFARTDLEATEINDYGREVTRKRLAGPHVERFPDPDEEDDAPIIIDSDSDASESGTPSSAYPPRAAPNHCIPGQINRITDLLLLTPNVHNLSINGYLHLCLCLDIPVFKRVRSLCLSPLLPFWPRPSEILFDEDHGPRLGGLERLMISGEGVGNEEADRLAGGRDAGGGGGGKMPKLRSVVWEVVHTIEPGRRPKASPERTYDLICRLQGLHLSQRTARDIQTRHIEVRLHPALLPAVLECATPHMRAAWESGEPFPSNGPNAVKVVESSAAKLGVTDGGEGNRKLHDGAREWWEEGALLLEDNGEKNKGSERE